MGSDPVAEVHGKFDVAKANSEMKMMRLTPFEPSNGFVRLIQVIDDQLGRPGTAQAKTACWGLNYKEQIWI